MSNYLLFLPIIFPILIAFIIRISKLDGKIKEKLNFREDDVLIRFSSLKKLNVEILFFAQNSEILLTKRMKYGTIFTTPLERRQQHETEQVQAHPGDGFVRDDGRRSLCRDYPRRRFHGGQHPKWNRQP